MQELSFDRKQTVIEGHLIIVLIKYKWIDCTNIYIYQMNSIWICFWKEITVKTSYRIFKKGILYFLHFHCTQNANFSNEFSVTFTGHVFDQKKSDFQLRYWIEFWKTKMREWFSWKGIWNWVFEVAIIGRKGDCYVLNFWSFWKKSVCQMFISYALV